ncbi:MAG: hypothetical protein J6Y14_04440 [Fibrobacter sp.]|nr:hypothetical protein [Fibrobacter sp.]
MNTISRQKKNCVILSEVRKDVVEGSCRRFLSSLVWILSSIILTACDFHGPWEYYPEERDVYAGIYTYGYILAGGETNICFSKVYELDEASSQNFAFYDSAYVTVSGVFYYRMRSEKKDTTIKLYNNQTNCFNESYYEGIVGETYALNAYFEWDSAGHKAKSRFKAVATIPSAVKAKGLNVPQQDGSYKWIENPRYDTTKRMYPIPDFRITFLEYPMDMEFVKVAMDYDKTVRGVLSIMNYDISGGESQNTTMNQMFKGVTDADETGYRGIAMHDPLEKQQNLGFSSNRTVAGNKILDTLYLMNMMLPIGTISVDLYSTDDAYVDYVEKVKQSVSDSRVVPKSNVKNGMGVFCGMAKTTINIEVSGDAVGFSHIAWSNCKDTEGDNADSWDSRACRLYQDVTCSGMPDEDVSLQGLQGANEKAPLYYRDSVYNRHVKACYASNVKAAMMLDTTKWSLFLPDSISEKAKANAYADGLKRYCVASNFESNKIADCSALENECLENPKKTNCKEYLWLWCADRGWNLEKYGQCRSAFVSRYYLQNLKSSILHREVEKVCDDREAGFLEIQDDGTAKTTHMFRTQICENWCKVEDDQVKCQ